MLDKLYLAGHGFDRKPWANIGLDGGKDVRALVVCNLDVRDDLLDPHKVVHPETSSKATVSARNGVAGSGAR